MTAEDQRERVRSQIEAERHSERVNTLTHVLLLMANPNCLIIDEPSCICISSRASSFQRLRIAGDPSD